MQQVSPVTVCNPCKQWAHLTSLERQAEGPAPGSGGDSRDRGAAFLDLILSLVVDHHLDGAMLDLLALEEGKHPRSRVETNS